MLVPVQTNVNKIAKESSHSIIQHCRRRNKNCQFWNVHGTYKKQNSNEMPCYCFILRILHTLSPVLITIMTDININIGTSIDIISIHIDTDIRKKEKVNLSPISMCPLCLTPKLVLTASLNYTNLDFLLNLHWFSYLYPSSVHTLIKQFAYSFTH